MADRSTKIARKTPEGDAAHLGLVRELAMMTRAVFTSRVSKTLVLLLIVLILVVIATAYGQIRLNGWNKPFYDALSRRDLRTFLFQLGVFFLLRDFSWSSMWRRGG
jgi:vitamin B12/bleomycin/antimicrobial peptide transport system ATP-binding/permease protein